MSVSPSPGIRGYLEAFRVLRPKELLQAVERRAGLPQSVGQPIYLQPDPQPNVPVGPQPALMDASLGEFEVNMVEALVGWKAWAFGECMGERSVLYSPSMGMIWRPDAPATGVCRCSGSLPLHRCGIYAADTPEQTHPYGQLQGQVYGWGRYIRGDKGWRAQLAYPKCFYLKREHARLIDHLKAFHVDIYVDEPLRVYSAEEEGYSLGFE